MTTKNLLVLALVLAASTFANAQDVTIRDFLRSAKPLAHENAVVIDEGYRLLEAAVKETKVDAKRMQEIIDLQIYLVKNDPSNYASEVVAPFATKHKALYEEGLKKLSPSDRTLIIEALKVFDREHKFGNG